MPSIHPSERPPLGWLVPCLSVRDIQASMTYYATLGFTAFGGDTGAGWSMLRNSASEIHLFQGHIERDLLNFRGGDLSAIREALDARGLEPSGTGDFEGRTYLDPDGRPVFFDTSAEEARAYAAGQPLTLPVEGDVFAGSGVDLGNLTWCLACSDLGATARFYETLGLVLSGGEPEAGWAIVTRKDHPPVFGERRLGTSLSLFKDMIPSDMLNFRGGHVAAIADHLTAEGTDIGKGVELADDGGESLLLADPDGRAVFLDTTPPERLYT